MFSRLFVLVEIRVHAHRIKTHSSYYILFGNRPRLLLRAIRCFKESSTYNGYGLYKSYKPGNCLQYDRSILFAVTLALVVTTIAKLQRVFRSLAKGCQKHICHLIIIGYSACSTDVKLSGSDIFELDRRLDSGFKTHQTCLKKASCPKK